MIRYDHLMPLRLYNSLTKKEEEFSPSDPKNVLMYTCGPTVYGRPHIGNYSSFLMADLLRRWLETGHGYTVKHVKNITDVGHLVADADHGADKVEQEAKKEKVDPLTIAEKYTTQYLEDEKALNMKEPFARPKATDTIPEMIAIIKELIKKGNAYETKDGIYFSVETFPAYGKLSGNTLEHLHAGSRIEINEEKKHPADFALWKKCVGENAAHLLRWNFESGKRIDSIGDDASAGFPGWHIECSAMSTKFLGQHLDIHTGGEDNIFPHHECEVAQSEAVFGAPFSRFWLHRRFIEILPEAGGDGEKMSKSLGNVYTLVDIKNRGYDALDLRFLLLSVHYRTRLKFSWHALDEAKKSRRKILEWIDETVQQSEKKSDAKNAEKMIDDFAQKFLSAMDRDLNVSEALAVVFELMSWQRNVGALSGVAAENLQTLIAHIKETFGCFESETQKNIPDAVQKLLLERADARRKKDFGTSDRLRDEIAALGFEVRDNGTDQAVKKI